VRSFDFPSDLHYTAFKWPWAGSEHRQRTQVCVNWTRTCESVAQHLLRSWELGQ